MSDIGHLVEEVSQPDLSFWCGLNHFSISIEEVQALLRRQGDYKYILVDPIGKLDLSSSTMGIVLPRIGSDFGHRAKKDTDIISKCGFSQPMVWTQQSGDKKIVCWLCHNCQVS